MSNTTITDNNDDDIDHKLNTFSVRYVLPALLVILLCVTALKNRSQLCQSLASCSLASCRKKVKNQCNKSNFDTIDLQKTLLSNQPNTNLRSERLQAMV